MAKHGNVSTSTSGGSRKPAPKRQVIAGTTSAGSRSSASRGVGPKLKGGTTTNRVRFG